MPKYLKPYLATSDQAQLLQSRGMEISDLDYAEKVLARIGYYRLSAYWFPFRKSGKYSDILSRRERTIVYDDFKPGANFDLVMALYRFDKELRLLFVDALERIEIALRTKISLQSGKTSPWAYRDANALDGKFARVRLPPAKLFTKHDDWLKRVDEKFDKSKEDFVKHYKDRYAPDALPIWISVELWDFGCVSHFFAGMKSLDRTSIAGEFALDANTLETWVRCLNDIRNICAHHSRLWNRPLVSRPSWPQAGMCPELDHLLADSATKDRLYGAACIVAYLMKTITPHTDWHLRLKKHVLSIPLNAVFTETSAGFAYGWDALPLWC